MFDEHDPCLSIQGAGDAVVLVPGLAGTARLFYRQVPLLARSYRVATYTLRDGAPSMSVLIADLAQVVDTAALAGEPVTIIGESFGGAGALSFALAHPERVRALVILNSFAYFRD